MTVEGSKDNPDRNHLYRIEDGENQVNIELFLVQYSH